jgi:hypothetical protein
MSQLTTEDYAIAMGYTKPTIIDDSQKPTGAKRTATDTYSSIYEYSPISTNTTINISKGSFCTCTQKRINTIILEMANRKGITPHLSTVYRYLKKQKIELCDCCDLKPIIEREIEYINKKYANKSEYKSALSTLLNRNNIREGTGAEYWKSAEYKKQMAFVCRLVETWSNLILKFDGYIAKKTLYRDVKGNDEKIFFYCKFLIEQGWFRKIGTSYHCTYNKNLSITNRFWFGKKHPSQSSCPLPDDNNKWTEIQQL